MCTNARDPLLNRVVAVVICFRSYFWQLRRGEPWSVYQAPICLPETKRRLLRQMSASGMEHLSTPIFKPTLKGVHVACLSTTVMNRFSFRLLLNL
jgi:hypothetical protein